MYSQKRNQSVTERLRSQHFARLAFDTCHQRRNCIEKLLLSRNERLEHGYPTMGSRGVRLEPNEFQKGRKLLYHLGDQNRTCLRCKQAFQVNWTGTQTPAPFPICSDGRKLYNFHVHDQISTSALQQFQPTPPLNKTNAHVANELFALDVEMVFTSRGQSPARVTLVSHTEAVLLDVLVRQSDEVFDPLTQYSGLTVQDLQKATWSLDAVRRAVLNELNEHSVLVGHGLAADLKALGIMHRRVIDTSLVYTWQGRRPSLRHLTQSHLGYRIQEGDNGHCSVEDALAAMRLAVLALERPELLAPKYRNIHTV